MDRMQIFAGLEYLNKLHRSAPATAHRWHPTHLLLPLSTTGVLNCLVNAEQQASGLRCRSDGISFDDGWFPNTSSEIISDILIKDIYTVPQTVTSVLLSQLIQDIGRVKPCVVAELSGDHLKRLGHGTNNELLLASDSPAVVSEVLAQLHKLLGSSSKDDRARLRLWAAIEVVKSLSSNLLLLEGFARSQCSIIQIMNSRLNPSSTRFQCAVQILLWNSAGRVPEEDLNRTLKSCGGAIQSTVHDLDDTTLGSCETFEEKQVGGERFNYFYGCPKSQSCTIILRGGAKQFMEETERSLHDAIMIVRRAMKNDSVVAGGGAIDMELSKYLRNYSRTIAGKEQLIIGAMAKAFEVIARQLCDNAGFDATNILNKLRQKHAGDGLWYGVDVINEDIADNFAACVWEPAIVKANAITAASEATCLLLSVDETVKNPRSGQGAEQMGGGGMPGGMGRGRGRPM